MFKKSTIMILLLLVIAMAPNTQPLNDEKILQHPGIQRVISQNPYLEMKLGELVERLPSNLNTEYFAWRIAFILETCSEPEELEIYFNELMRDSRNFSKPMLENRWADISIKKANNAPLTPREKEIITTVIEDFQVNENVGSCWQSNPTVAVDNEGNFVVVWEDGRHGKWFDKRGDRYGGFPIWQFDIYARCFNKNGQPLGNSFLVTDMGLNPAAAIDTQGRIIISWVWNMRRFVHYIYAQRFDFNGNSLGDSFKVNEVSNGGTPDVACDCIGNFVITWSDGRNNNGDIYAQRYDSFGNRIENNFKVNDDTTTSRQNYPQIAFDSQSNFIITWMDYRNGNSDIYAQRYDSLRNTIDINLKVNDDPGTSWQEYPDIAVDGDGKFVITWCDGRDSNIGDIFAQRYHADGKPDSTNFKVNDDTRNNRQYNPVVSIDKEGSFLITWYDNRNGNYDIYAQHFDSSGIAMGENKKVTDDTNSVDHRYPSISASREGIFVITWIDQRNGDYDIYSQRYDSLMQPLEPNFRVNDDTVSSYQLEPAIAVNGNGNSVIVWRDYRNEMWGDIYGQRYDANGSALDTNFRVNDDIGWNGQEYPDIAMFKDGHFIITWQDNRNDNWDIYAQHYNSSGQKIDGNFMVNDIATKDQSNPAIAAADDSFFVIVWQDSRNYYNGDIYAQRFNYDGQKLGVNFQVNDDAESKRQDFPDVAVKNDGSFIVTWEDDRIDRYADIYAQRYDSVGDTIGRNFKVNDDIGESGQWYPKIAISSEGTFVITWQDNRNNWHAYAQYYNSSGQAEGTNFKVNDEFFEIGGYYPDISSCQNSNFVIVFLGRTWGIMDIYLQYYNKNGLPISENNFRITFDGDSPRQSYPCITTSSTNILLAWEDNRVPGQGWDIFAKAIEIDTICDVADKEIVNTAIPERFFLFQNYPNPFNSETIVRYQLPKSCEVTLRILNLLGQEVKTLVDEKEDAGYHKVSWNGKNNSEQDVVSGIYIYRIQAGDYVQSKKMLFLR